ncbi:Glycosyltransferase [Gulosibacter molinativorax]|nr:Glycosyltransferase [Gulosibacter molinativorax]
MAKPSRWNHFPLISALEWSPGPERFKLPMVSVPARAPYAASAKSPYPSFDHRPPSRASVAIAAAAPVISLLLFLWFLIHTLLSLPTLTGAGIAWLVVSLLAASALAYSSGMYLLGRAGALVRLRNHRRLTRAELDVTFLDDDSTMTVLVPSYAEEPRVVNATLWSAALQEFPSLRVVLLIDDKPHPTDPAVLAKLDETRALPGQIAAELAEPHRQARLALNDFACARGDDVCAADLQALASAYDAAAEWLTQFAARWSLTDHSDAFLVDQVFLGLATEFTELADGFRAQASANDLPNRDMLQASYLRLVRIFSCKLDTFERKRYVSLSQEANKAMNLNSYLSLMGHAWQVTTTHDGDVLVATTDPTAADFIIPDADYVLTLDADSLLVRDYCTRLVHELQRPGNERVAVIQTPYCSFPGAPTRVERVAGATTDLQHLHHLGKTHFNATFWVGANAIIRREALTDIEEINLDRGFKVHTYIQDRTVIEDTESSMDLAARGWSLINYPERLSYSATPPDFGSLVVQRRRWANGGLIILPKIVDVIRGRLADRERIGLGEVALRLDYLGSIAWTSIAVPIILLLPILGTPLSPFLFLISVPFIIAQAADLRRVGHRLIDVVWVQSLNLVLLPVNLAGVLKSIQQGITRRKIPFARTPKIADRVAAPGLFVILPYLIALGLAAASATSIMLGNVLGSVFAALTALLALVGSVVFIGVHEGYQDIVAGLKLSASARARVKNSALESPALKDPTEPIALPAVSSGY